jgi:two-component system, NtrC family, sensor kinase
MTAFHRFAFVLLLLSRINLAAGQVSKIDSLNILLEKEPTDSGRISLLLKLGDLYVNKRADSCLYFSKLALDLNNKTIRSPELSDEANFSIARAYRTMGNYPEALKMLLESLKYAEQEKDTMEIFYRKREIMWVYRGTGDFAEQQKMVNELEELSNLVFSANRKRGIDLLRIVYNSKARLFYDENQLDSARYYFSWLYNDKKESPSLQMTILAAGGLSDVYLATGHYDSALYYARIYSAGSIRTGRSDLYRNADLKFANIFFNSSAFDSAFHYAYLGLNAFKSISDTSRNLSQILLLLSRLHERNKKFDSAYYYLTAYYRQDNEDLKQQRINDVHDLSMQDILNKKELERKVQAERGRYESRLKIYGLSGGLALLLLAAGFLYRNNQQKHIANQLLVKKNDEIENALSELKAAQEQLIHAEKMASLGELTAGIAHEIQNPLNFVNNFSDVNQDLVDELKDELQKGNLKESIHIADALKENEAKINVHGKRADAIVKGMLQHSRATSEQKELTDINKLADEYLRLAYHGYRAKHKSFNAALETNFDPMAGKINILPQDLGRVLLNLFNNAFYAVAERKSEEGEAFHPLVTVTTIKTGNKTEIIISDNGKGVPEDTRTKIFQPFFTTKPSGQGTGLGLSLGYDIIKKGHGGDLLAEQTPGGGASFRIILPA